MEKQVESRNIDFLDRSLRPHYIRMCLQRWLNLVLDLVVAVIAIGIIGLAVLLRGTTTAAGIGVALNVILITNSTLVSLIHAWTGLEISLGAVSRLRKMQEETPTEHKRNEDTDPPANWPQHGNLEISDVSLSYG
jgi:ATP-binding cassette, subfamily C (CFTR/MRP), member 1